MRKAVDLQKDIRDLGEKLIKFDLKNANRYYYLRDTSREFNIFIPLVLGFWIVLNLYAHIINFAFGTNFNTKVDTFSQCLVGGVFFLLVFFEIRARIKVNKQHKEAKALLAKREAMISQLNEYKSQYKKGKITDWWNHINGFDLIHFVSQTKTLASSQTFRNCCVSHTPFCRIEVDEDRIPRLRLRSNIERNITGAEALSLRDDPNLRMITNAGIENEKTYGLAEFVIHERSEGIIKNYATLSEQDIQSKLEEFRAENDSKERFLNTLEGQYNTTDEERFIEGTMSIERYTESSTERTLKEFNYEQNLRQNRDVYIGDQLVRTVVVRPIGVAILDKSGTYQGLFLYKEMPSREFYSLGKDDAIKCFDKWEPDSNTDYIFSRFLLMNFGEGFDVAQERPANFTDREWAYWVYAQYYKS